MTWLEPSWASDFIFDSQSSAHLFSFQPRGWPWLAPLSFKGLGRRRGNIWDLVNGCLGKYVLQGHPKNQQIPAVLVGLFSLSFPSGDLAEGTRVCTATWYVFLFPPFFSSLLESLKQVNSKRAWWNDLCHCHDLFPIGDPVSWSERALMVFTLQCKDIRQIPRECEKEINSEIRLGVSPGLTMTYLSSQLALGSKDPVFFEQRRDEMCPSKLYFSVINAHDQFN